MPRKQATVRASEGNSRSGRSGKSPSGACCPCAGQKTGDGSNCGTQSQSAGVCALTAVCCWRTPWGRPRLPQLLPPTHQLARRAGNKCYRGFSRAAHCTMMYWYPNICKPYIDPIKARGSRSCVTSATASKHPISLTTASVRLATAGGCLSGKDRRSGWPEARGAGQISQE